MWDPSPDADVNGYNIYYGPASGSYTNKVVAGNVTNATISGLVEGGTYFFAATATNTSGLESDPSNEVSFSVLTGAGNQPPTLNPLSNLTISERASLQTVTLSGITSGANNETQILTVSVTSSNPGFIPNPAVTYTSPNTSGNLSFTPAVNASGTATITVTVNDGQAQSNTVTRTFTVTVNAVNQAPTISAITNQVTVQNIATPPIQFTVSDTETAASNLTLYASSSNLTLVSNTSIVFGGSRSSRTVTLTPSPGQFGDADITIAVSDGTATARTTFRLSVLISVPKPGPTLTLKANGSGNISPNLGGQTLTAGKIYTVTATPKTGHEFAGWTGSIASPAPKLSFVLSSNLLLEANFVPSPFISTRGAYYGLFYEADQVRQHSAGSFSVSVTTRGIYSGRLQLGANRYSFSGRLDLQCQATNVILRRDDGPLRVEVRVGSGDEADQIFGRLTDGVWVSSLSGDRALFNSKTNPAPNPGNYTVIIPGQDGDPALPTGHGFGTVRVDPGGRARFAGALADGVKVSQGAPLSKHGLWPFYVSLYSGKGSLMSWLAFTNQPSDDLNGPLSWIKLADVNARYYAGGFTNECAVIGSVYVRPVATTNHVLNLTNAFVAFSGGDLISDFTNSVALWLNSRVMNLSSNRLSLSFSLSTGTFVGSTMDPSSGKSLSFKGAVLQKRNGGYGFLLGTNRSSQVIIAP